MFSDCCFCDTEGLRASVHDLWCLLCVTAVEWNSSKPSLNWSGPCKARVKEHSIVLWGRAGASEPYSSSEGVLVFGFCFFFLVCWFVFVVVVLNYFVFLILRRLTCLSTWLEGLKTTKASLWAVLMCWMLCNEARTGNLWSVFELFWDFQQANNIMPENSEVSTGNVHCDWDVR